MSSEAKAGATPHKAGAFRDPNLLIVFGVALIAVLRADSVAPAFPGIGRAFHLSSDAVGLLTTCFALPSVFLTPILGLLADRWGRKRILVPSLLLFGVAGGACALAPSYPVLLALRLLQGIGAASLSMLNITLIADLYSGPERSAAMGYNASVRSIGSTIYPLLGGALATLGWAYPFVLSLLAIPVGLLILFRLENPEPQGRQPFAEYLGGAWRSLQSRQVVGLFAAGCVVFVTMFGAYLTYFPFVLEDRFAALPLVIGLLMSGRSVVNAILAAQLGRLTRVWSERTLLKASFVLYGLVFVMIPLMPSLWLMVPVTILLGAAEGLYWPSNHVLLGTLAPMEHRAGFMALNDMVNKLGQTVGPLLMGGAYGLWGAPGAFSAAAALSFLTFLMTALLLVAPKDATRQPVREAP